MPNFTGLAYLAGQIEDFDSATLSGLYTVLVFYEVPCFNHPNPNHRHHPCHSDHLSCPPQTESWLIFRATSCLFLQASFAHLPPPSRATSVVLSPSPLTPSRRTGSSSARLSYLLFHLNEILREFAGASLKELSIPLVEDKTGQICRSFGVFDPTTHTAVPTAFILDEEGELMASFTTSTQVIKNLIRRIFTLAKGGGLCRGGGKGGGCLQGVRHHWCLVPPAQGHSSMSMVKQVKFLSGLPTLQLSQLYSGLLAAWRLPHIGHLPEQDERQS